MVNISVIVPVFNSEAYVGQCLDSLINQTLHNIEIICIDDASTDQSFEILKKYEQMDSRVKIIKNTLNEGAAYSRNKGIDYATGEYIQFVDSDDYLMLDALEKIYFQMKETHAEICFIQLQQVRESGQSVEVGIKGMYPDTYVGEDLLKLFVHNQEFFLYLCSAIYKRSYVKNRKMYFKKLVVGEGGDFILRALCYAEKVVVLNEHCYFYRIHIGSVTQEKMVASKTLYGQLIQYITILSIFSYEKQESEGLRVFLEYQYGKVYSGIRNLTENDIKDFELKLPNNYYRYIFYGFLKENQVYDINISEETKSKINQRKKVIIYGAGRATQDVILELNKYAAEIIAIAVSDEKGNPEVLFGHKIERIDRLTRFNDNAVVLVAANSKYNCEIEKNLKQLQFSDYEFLNIKI